MSRADVDGSRLQLELKVISVFVSFLEKGRKEDLFGQRLARRLPQM